MAFQLSQFSDVGQSGLSPALLAALLDEHARVNLPRLELFWSYYRNPMDPAVGGPLAGRSAPPGIGSPLLAIVGGPPTLAPRLRREREHGYQTSVRPREHCPGHQAIRPLGEGGEDGSVICFCHLAVPYQSGTARSATTVVAGWSPA